MTRAVARLLAALAAGMIASGLLGATAHAQSTPAESPKAAKVQPAMTEAGKVLTGIDVLAASGFAPLEGTARRPSDEPCRSHQVRAEHDRRAGGRTGRYARRVVQPRAWPRRRPRGRHRIAARCAHRTARSQSLRHHTASARLHAGGPRRRRHRPAGRGRALLHLRHHHGLHPGGGGEAEAQGDSSSTGPTPSVRQACAGRCPIRTSNPSPTISACPSSTA